MLSTALASPRCRSSHNNNNGGGGGVPPHYPPRDVLAAVSYSLSSQNDYQNTHNHQQHRATLGFPKTTDNDGAATSSLISLFNVDVYTEKLRALARNVQDLSIEKHQGSSSRSRSSFSFSHYYSSVVDHRNDLQFSSAVGTLRRHLGALTSSLRSDRLALNIDVRKLMMTTKELQQQQQQKHLCEFDDNNLQFNNNNNNN
eukprot:PhM_4_TR18027/c11_g1_i1/m.93117